jgi:antibiotic biosynthesis monooxygenase (ABM) superfamily enzyme
MSAVPTVIVSRRVRPGAEKEFERWNAKIRAAAQSFPGSLGSETQPPNDAHPEDWVIVYRFASTEDLDRWLRSPEREALLAEGEPLIAGPEREQRIGQPHPGAEPVTAVLSQRVRPGAEADFRDFHVDVSRTMSEFDGYLRSDFAPPIPGVQDDHVIVFAFDSKANLDRWLESDERQAILRRIEPMIEGERTLNVVGGFGGWFPTGDDPGPKRWKQAVAVLIALFPTTLTLGMLQRWLVPDAPWVPSLFVANVLGIAALTWVLMPFVTRRLGPWLHR